jgi:hypothetical protein
MNGRWTREHPWPFALQGLAIYVSLKGQSVSQRTSTAEWSLPVAVDPTGGC